MSNRYEAAQSTAAGPGSADEIFEFRNSSTRRCYIEEIGVFLGAATSTGVGLVRATAQGTNGTQQLGQAEDPNAPAGTASMYTAVTTGLTLGSNWMRRAILPAAIGAGIIWTWPQSDRLMVATSASIAVVNIAGATGANPTHAYIVWTE